MTEEWMLLDTSAGVVFDGATLRIPAVRRSLDSFELLVEVEHDGREAFRRVSLFSVPSCSPADLLSLTIRWHDQSLTEVNAAPPSGGPSASVSFGTMNGNRMLFGVRVLGATSLPLSVAAHWPAAGVLDASLPIGHL